MQAGCRCHRVGCQRAEDPEFTAASLDGFIADSGNSLDWLFQAEAAAKAESASGDLYREFYAQVGALAMGATTYEWVLRHEKLLDKPASWP